MRVSSWAKSVVAVVAVAVVLGGCTSTETRTVQTGREQTVATKPPKKKRMSQKQKAEAEWKLARANVLMSLAKDQYANGSLDKSRETVNDAMRLAPEHAGLRVLSAKLYIETGRLELADKDLAIARHLDPKDPEADYLSGVVYQRWQQPERALGFYEAAHAKAPTELAYLMARAEMLVAAGERKVALGLLQEKVIYFEHSAAIRDAVGQLLVQEGRYAEAIDMLRSATILATDDVGMREHLAMAFYFNGQYREASVELERVMKDEAHANRADLVMALGECKLQLNQARDARDTFDRATQLAPANVGAWLGLAKATLRLNDDRRAELALRKALSVQAGSSEAHLLLGYLRLRQDRLTDALAAFQKASLLDRADTVSLCMTGFALEKLGRSDEAIRFYADALKIKPNDELAARLMASVEVGE
jgi:Flp pilus assembly protein TadD